jgi:acyl-CoA synthetase (AMP-forming)/AMP-acid ligase II
MCTPLQAAVLPENSRSYQRALFAPKRHRVTEFFLPPTVIYRMLDYPGVQQSDFASVRYFGYGSAPMSVEKLRQAIERFGPRMAQFFGLSEAPALCTFLAPQEHVPSGKPVRRSPTGRTVVWHCPGFSHVQRTTPKFPRRNEPSLPGLLPRKPREGRYAHSHRPCDWLRTVRGEGDHRHRLEMSSELTHGGTLYVISWEFRGA